MFQQQAKLIEVISQPRIYNDVRDQIIGNFNKVQAYWGTGKAYYSKDAVPVELSESLPTQRFKAIGYAQRKADEPSSRSLEGMQSFALLLKQDISDTGVPQLEQNMRMLFGGANCNVKIESRKVLPDNKCIVTMSILDPSTGRRFPVDQVINHLTQPQQNQQLNQLLSNNLIQLIPLQEVSEKEVEEYLNRVPDGIDPKLWEQAKLNNPDPKKFIPIPLIGFQALNERFKIQQFETQQQRARLRQLSSQVSEIQKQVAAMKSKIAECRRKKIVLGNRVLKVMITQEINNRRGLPIQADEEKLRSRMENMLSQLHAPSNYRSCLNELMAKLKQIQNYGLRSNSVPIDEAVIDDIKAHLKNEHKGIDHLIRITKQDNEILAKTNALNSQL